MSSSRLDSVTPQLDDRQLSRQRSIGAPSWWLSAPFLLAFALFVCVPVVWTVILSLYKGGVVRGLTFTGVSNYEKAWADPVFLITLRNTLFYVGVILPIVMATSLGLASLIVHMRRFQTFVKVCLFIPLVSSVVPLARIWMPFFGAGPDGLLNHMVAALGIQPINWLGSPKAVLLSIVMFELWRGVGLWTLIFIGGIAQIPHELYQAASIDGAGPLQRFRHITVPSLRPTFLFLAIMGLIWNFQIFDAVFVFTKGGPGYASYTMAWYIYREAFLRDELGMGATMGVLLLIGIAGLVALTARAMRGSTQ